MNDVWSVYKPVGITPLQLLGQLKFAYPKLTTERLGYAGRLDPMADGVLVVLLGEATTKQEALSKLGKAYQVQVIMGVSTDSYDVLGLPFFSYFDGNYSLVDLSLSRLTGTISQAFPPYSAARVQGKPLFWWARNNRLDEVVIPCKDRLISQFELRDSCTILPGQLLSEIRWRIERLDGDFRQNIILRTWQEGLTMVDQPLCLATFEIDCSSGTYVRSLIHTLGKILGCGATCLQITRTRVGNFTLENALRLT
jgi:tRNA pseudouridine55 synthase